MGDNESKSRSEATPLPIAYSRWPIAVLFPNTRFYMAVARTMTKAHQNPHYRTILSAAFYYPGG